MPDSKVSILIDTIVRGEREVNKIVSSLEQGITRGKVAADAFNAAMGNGQKVMQLLSRQTKELVASYLSLSAAERAFSGMIRILKEGEQAAFAMTASIAAARREFRDTGSLAFWESAVRNLSRELLVFSETALRGAISRTIDMTKRLGFSAEQMEELVRRTADISAGRVDLQQGIERVTSALRGEAEAAEYLGLTLNENYVKAWMEAHDAHGTAWKDLTDLEKAQVRYQVFLEQTAAFQGRAAESAKTFQGALMLLDKAVSDAVLNNEDLVEAVKDVAGFIRDNSAAIGEAASSLIKLSAEIIRLAMEWKELLAALGGAWLAAKGVIFLTRAIQALRLAKEALIATRIGRDMADIATAAGAAAPHVGRLGLLFKGTLAVGAAAGAYEIGNLAYQTWEWIRASRELKKAKQEGSRLEKKANETARELGEQLGLNVGSMKEFLELVEKGVIVWDDQTDSWRKSTDAAREQAKAVSLTEQQLKRLEERIRQTADVYDVIKGKVGGYFDFAAERARHSAESEEDAAGAVLDIQRKKTEALLQLARDEAEQKSAILSRAGASDSQAAEISKKIAGDLLRHRISTLEAYAGHMRSALDKALQDEKRYADEIRKLETSIKQEELSTRDAIRNLRRQEMDEEQSWYDRREEAEEKLAEAQVALLRGEFEQAKALAQQARDLGRTLAQEVRTAEGEIRIEKALGFDIAEDVIKKAGRTIRQVLEEQQYVAERAQSETAEKVEKLKEEFAKVSLEAQNFREQLVELGRQGLDIEIRLDAEAALETRRELEKPIETVWTVRQQVIQESAAGGPVLGFAGGGAWSRSGRLAGYGGGDRIRALLEAGEWVIRKEAVRKYGDAFMAAINSLRFPAPAFSIPAPKFAYAAGGPVGGGASRTVRVELAVGGQIYPMVTSESVARAFEDYMKRLASTRMGK